MQIHSYAEIVWCREVIFENGKYDKAGRHPGIVIVPTSENDDFAYCLCMTSDKNRANRKKHKYVQHKIMPKKDSYVNIKQIVERTNIRDDMIKEMKQEDFLKLLEDFYNYQMNLKPQQKEFIKIKKKVKTLIELLKINEKLDLESRKIRYDELDKYSMIKETKRINRIYSAELLLRYKGLSAKINSKCLSEEKERIYVEKLLDLYRKLKETEYSKIDLDNPNNSIREIYINSKQNNYLLNTDSLFYDVIDLFKITEENHNYSKFIDEFMKKEEKRQQEKRNKIEQKNKLRVEEKNKLIQEKAQAKLNKKRGLLIQKYGDSDWFKTEEIK